jgi:ribosomal protein S18 acetylase RimI-like enzyme
VIFSNFWKKPKDAIDLSSIKIICDKNIDALPLQDLCASVGWAKREAVMIDKSLQNSIIVVTAWEHERLVGFARATGDGVFNATIWDVVVHPNYQRQGIGQLILRTLLKELDEAKVQLITLLAEPGQEHFYRKFGFITDAVNLRGMVRERG